MSRVSVVIMAGGKGERFWPKSRISKPKQFLSLTGDNRSMIQKTYDRISSFVEKDDIYVVTNEKYKSLVIEHLPELPQSNILCEPEGKNTAPAIAYAAAVIDSRDKDSIMVVLSSDHLIKDEKEFISILQKAVKKAEKDSDSLITLGIKPAYAETGYGYIEYDKDSVDSNGIYKVKRFVEKPVKEVAEEYIRLGNFLWNSGMFVWRTGTIIASFKEFMPSIYDSIIRLQNAYGSIEFETAVKEFYKYCQSESIDYGIMEKSSHIYIIPSDFGWDDVGSWLSVERINERDENGNVIQGESVAIDCKNVTVMGDERLVALIGLEDVVVVDSGDVLLVCKKSESQRVKEVIKEIRERNKNKLL